MGRVLVNDSCLRRARTGVGQYLTSLVAHWPAQCELRLVGFMHERLLRRSQMPANRFEYPPLSYIPPIDLVPLSLIKPPPRAAHRWLDHLRPAWLEVRKWFVKQEFRRKKRYSSFFEPNNIALAELPPTVTTIMDLSVLELPQMHPPERVGFWRKRLEQGMRWTDHWICISEATAAAMARVLGVPAAKMTVIPLASRWPTPPRDWTAEAVRRQLRLPERYLLYLGTLEPRKNLLRLLDAYASKSWQWRQQTPLILAGMPGWGGNEFWRALADHAVADEVMTTGYLCDAQVVALLRGAAALLYPSLYEGFGLPPLEAMGLDVPVVASTADSLREVCGDAAPLIDPHDVEGWAEWMERASEPGEQRDWLIETGAARASEFSWEKVAQEHHDLFLRLKKQAA